MNPGDMGGLAEKRECGAHLSSWAGRPLERKRQARCILTGTVRDRGFWS
jgi:hypothetical protein